MTKIETYYISYVVTFRTRVSQTQVQLEKIDLDILVPHKLTAYDSSRLSDVGKEFHSKLEERVSNSIYCVLTWICKMVDENKWYAICFFVWINIQRNIIIYGRVKPLLGYFFFVPKYFLLYYYVNHKCFISHYLNWVMI